MGQGDLESPILPLKGTVAVQLRLMWPHGNEGEARVAKPDLPRENGNTDFRMKYDLQMLATNSLFFFKQN